MVSGHFDDGNSWEIVIVFHTSPALQLCLYNLGGHEMTCVPKTRNHPFITPSPI